MQPLFPTLRRGLRWLRRIGHCGGFGIQSPFAFNLVTRVVYEREAFYAYARLERTVDAAADGLRLRDARLLLRLANDHQPRTVLVVGRRTRAAEHYLRAGKPSALIRRHEGGGRDSLDRCAAELAAALLRPAAAHARPDTEATPPRPARTGLRPEKTGIGPEKTGLRPVKTGIGPVEQSPGGIDLLYLEAEAGWEAAWEAVLPYASDRTLFIVHGLHRSRADRTAWRRLTADKRVRVTFDLYDFGLAYFDSRLLRAAYVVNYF